MRFVLEIEYDGTNYCGWQIQPNGTSVQEVLQKALEVLLKPPINLVGSGRTDAKVHAIKQVAHFDAETSIPPQRIAYAVNSLLGNHKICVKKSYLVNDDFHARFSAKRKTYQYKMYVSEVGRPLYYDRALWLKTLPNVEDMKLASSVFVGTHDFKGFCSVGSSIGDTVRTIFNTRIFNEGEFIVFEVTGNGFLYNMVRIMVGVLLDIGYGKMTIEDLKQTFVSRIRPTSKTAEPQGLYLVDVNYNQE